MKTHKELIKEDYGELLDQIAKYKTDLAVISASFNNCPNNDYKVNLQKEYLVVNTELEYLKERVNRIRTRKLCEFLKG